mgnify:FL=1
MQILLYLFPLLFLGSFALSLLRIGKGDVDGIFIFLIGGLPFYAISLSLLFMVVGKTWIPFIQVTKEIVIITALITLWLQKERFRFSLLDKLIFAFFIFSLIFVPIPLGDLSLFEKLIAFKSLSFFALVYFCGRLFPLQKTHLQKYPVPSVY